MEWWIWALLGLILLGIEACTLSGFYIFFFGIGAILVSLSIIVGVADDAAIQWLLFSLFSVAGLLLLRSWLLQTVSPNLPLHDRDSIVGQRARVKGTIAPQALGWVDHRGTPWQARNLGTEILEAGDECQVISISGLTLEVKREP
jgi:inner membrane protein